MYYATQGVTANVPHTQALRLQSIWKRASLSIYKAQEDQGGHILDKKD